VWGVLDMHSLLFVARGRRGHPKRLRWHRWFKPFYYNTKSSRSRMLNNTRHSFTFPSQSRPKIQNSSLAAAETFSNFPSCDLRGFGYTVCPTGSTPARSSICDYCANEEGISRSIQNLPSAAPRPDGNFQSVIKVCHISLCTRSGFEIRGSTT
jgi:hypothetical protein